MDELNSFLVRCIRCLFCYFFFLFFNQFETIALIEWILVYQCSLYHSDWKTPKCRHIHKKNSQIYGTNVKQL